MRSAEFFRRTAFASTCHNRPIVHGRSRRPAITVVLGLTLSVITPGLFLNAAPQGARAERFTALAVPPPGAGSPTPIEFVVERWSTDAENEKVMTGLTELGTRGMFQALLKLKPVASLATPGSAGYPIRYAWKTTGPDGIEHITFATDRPVGSWEASNLSRSLDYPITIIELRMKPGNTGGTGQIVVASQLHRDALTKMIILENYDITPVQLTAVRRAR